MKKGFTLAEVLITLGIIGVVAALTMPMLIQNYKNRVYVNQLKKTYSVLQNGFRLIIAQDGATEMSDTYYSQIKNNYSINSNEFYSQVFPIFKNAFDIVQGYSVTDYKKLNPQGGNITNSQYCKQNVGKVYGLSYKQTNKNQCVSESGVLFLLKDGTYFLLEGGLNTSLINEIVVDTNGLKAPNTLGYDVFSFFLLSNGSIVPSGGEKFAKARGGEANWQRYYWSTGSGYTCKVKGRSYSGYGSGCSASIIENGWKIEY